MSKTDIYRDSEITLSNVKDAKTGKAITMDLSALTLPQRVGLEVVRKAAKKATNTKTKGSR